MFIGIMRELWRVCTPGALVQTTPDPPTTSSSDPCGRDRRHAGPLFSQRQPTVGRGRRRQPLLALIHGIDFELGS